MHEDDDFRILFYPLCLRKLFSIEIHNNVSTKRGTQIASKVLNSTRNFRELLAKDYRAQCPRKTFLLATDG